MFFTIQIVLFIFSLDSLSSLAIRDKIKTRDLSFSTNTQRKWKSEDYTPKDETSFRKHVPLFEIIKNLTKTQSPNLKSNVFDKMLSDEMLSIKQHFFDQDIKTSTIAILSKSYVPTPTLEVKQQWPINKFRSEFNRSTASNYNESLSNEQLKDDNKPEENNKVLEPRSLPEVTSRFGTPIYLYQGSKICTCMKNPLTGVTCTPHLRSGGQYICTQSGDLSKRKSSSLSTNSMRLHDQTNSHSCTQEVLNELKLPRKFNHRKTTKPNINDNLYYNNEKEVLKDESYEDDSDNLKEDYVYDDKVTNQNQHEILEFYTNKYEEKDYGTKTEKCSPNEHTGKGDEGRKLVLKDRTIKKILNDLKVYYGDSVIKDCCCSLMSSSSYVHSMRFHKFLLAFIIIVNIFTYFLAIK
ncbi:hypothetical protein evm_012482 [Chilo suppressalis]|nr:hypothetical protein evm_012482 [Chilo suppressalis]